MMVRQWDRHLVAPPPPPSRTFSQNIQNHRKPCLQVTIPVRRADDELLLLASAPPPPFSQETSHNTQNHREPCLQVTILVRRADDELLLLASDGLWDVLSNQEACTLAKRCLRRARQRGASRQSAARIAATVLTRAAVDRGSRDNVTVTSPFCTHTSDLLVSINSPLFPRGGGRGGDVLV